MIGLPLRARLTLLVSLVFGVALAVLAIVGVDRMETTLRADTERNAEALLLDFFDDLTSGRIDAEESAAATTRFVYLDADGQDLAPGEFDELLNLEVLSMLPDDPFGEGEPILVPPGLAPPGLDAEAPIITSFESGPIELFSSVGPAELLDRGDDVIAVGAPVELGNRDLLVAVSSPLQPVRDSVSRLRQLLLITVPLLIVAIAAATWLIVGRALRPVEAMTARVDRITSESLDQRVPQPTGRDELSHLASTMNRMLARLEKARDAQRQFVSDASHELRSPITATQATLEVARTSEHVDWQSTSQVLLDENARLASLVDDLLLSAQLDEGRLLADQSEIDLDELCVVEANRPFACEVHVRVESPARISGNLAHVTRGVRNLVDNAARHADNRVDIIVSTSDGDGVVEVLDDGRGIAPESLEVIFERFTRVDESRHRTPGDDQRQPGGAGLGLAIARQVADTHGGTVSAANRTDRDSGAHFTLRLPLA